MNIAQDSHFGSCSSGLTEVYETTKATDGVECDCPLLLSAQRLQDYVVYMPMNIVHMNISLFVTNEEIHTSNFSRCKSL